LDVDEADRLKRGQSVRVRDARAQALLESRESGAIAWAREGNRAVAIVRTDGEIIRPVRVFHL